MIRSVALLAFATPALADAPRVAVDIVPTASLTARVMEGVGAPTLVVPPLVSPHGYAMRPSEAAALEQADVVIRIGPALAPWFEEAAEALAPEAAGLVLLDVPGTVLRALGEDHDHGEHADHDDHAGHEDHADHDDHSEHEDHDHAEAGHGDHADRGHDDHGEEDHADHDGAAHHDHGYADHAAAPGEPVDPHAWLDPRNGVAWLSAIAETLAAADPGNAATYRANAAAGAAELGALEAELTATLAPVQDRAYLTLHDAYGYFEGRTGLDSAGALHLSDAASAGPAHMADLRERLEAEGIACLFTEPQLDDRLATRLLEGTDVTLAVLDPIGGEGDVGPDGYASVLKRMAKDMAACLIP